jgi:hypothetical protein
LQFKILFEKKEDLKELAKRGMLKMRKASVVEAFL